MKCSNVKNNVILYLEKELSPEDENQFRLHLNFCSDCSKLLTEVIETYESVSLEENIEPEPFFAESVLYKLENETIAETSGEDFSNYGFSAYFKRIAFSGVLAIIVLLVMFYIVNGSLPFNFDSDAFSTDNVSSMIFDNF